MKILQIVHSLRKGGAERLCLQIAKKCREAGNEVHILSFENIVEYPNLMEQGIQVSSIFNNVQWKKDFLNLIYRTQKLIKAVNPDIIHAHLPSAAIITYLSTYRAFIQTLHSTKYWFWNDKSMGNTLMRVGEGLSIKSDRCRSVAVSEDVANAYSSQYDIPIKKLTVINNGIDLQEFNIGTRKTKIHNTYRILMVGTLNKTKNQKFAIDAFSKLSQRIPEAELMIIGDGPTRNDLVNQAAIHKLENRILFLGQRSDIRDLLATSDQFWHTSLFEGLPLSIVEAMAMGVPVIATDIPGIHGLCIDKKNCLLSPIDSDQQFADKSIEIYNNRQLGHHLAEEAFQYVKTKFDINLMLNFYMDLYEKHAQIGRR